MATQVKKRRSGVPSGNAGEYFVMGELLRRKYDAQLADRNTAAYDILVGRPTDKALRKLQVKCVRIAPWYVKVSQFQGESLDMVTIYVVIGSENSEAPVRYFIAQNRELADKVGIPKWKDKSTQTAFMSLKSVLPFENKWENVLL
jgi:hypothetical protein